MDIQARLNEGDVLRNQLRPDAPALSGQLSYLTEHAEAQTGLLQRISSKLDNISHTLTRMKDD